MRWEHSCFSLSCVIILHTQIFSYESQNLTQLLLNNKTNAEKRNLPNNYVRSVGGPPEENLWSVRSTTTWQSSPEEQDTHWNYEFQNETQDSRGKEAEEKKGSLGSTWTGNWVINSKTATLALSGSDERALARLTWNYQEPLKRRSITAHPLLQSIN